MSNNQWLMLASALVVALGILAIYASLLRQANKEKSKWGINLKALTPGHNLRCPGCGNEMPTIRKPKNLRQTLWGGFTCEFCGREYDKWLNEIDSPRKMQRVATALIAIDVHGGAQRILRVERHIETIGINDYYFERICKTEF